jgi:predicted transcriptional regulator
MLPRLEEIARRRRGLNLTQKELALLAGVSQSMIAKIESLSISPSYENTKRIFDALEELERRAEIKIKEIVSRKVVSVRSQEPVSKATELMRQTGFSQLPVLDDHFAVGSISERTMLAQILKVKNPAELSRKRVEDIMDEPFPQLDEESPLSAVSTLLQYSPAVITTKKGHISGIVTRADLLKVVRNKI